MLDDNDNIYSDHYNNDNDCIDYYSALNIPLHANDQTIRQSYLQLARLHPDKISNKSSLNNNSSNIDTTAPFLRIKQSNDLLTNKYKRYAYDYYGHDGIQALKQLDISYEYRTDEYIKSQIYDQVCRIRKQRAIQRSGMIVQQTRILNVINIYKLLNIDKKSSKDQSESVAEAVYEVDQIDENTNIFTANKKLKHDVFYYYKKLINIQQTTIKQIWQYSVDEFHAISIHADINRRRNNVDAGTGISYDYQHSNNDQFGIAASVSGTQKQIAATATHKLNRLNNIEIATRYNLQNNTFHNTLHIHRLFSSSKSGLNASTGALQFSFAGTRFQNVGIQNQFPVSALNVDVSTQMLADADDINLMIKLTKNLHKRQRQRGAKIYADIHASLNHTSPLLAKADTWTESLTSGDGVTGNVDIRTSVGCSYAFHAGHSVSFSVTCGRSSINANISYKHKYFSLTLPIQMYPPHAVTRRRWVITSMLPVTLLTIGKFVSLLYKQRVLKSKQPGTKYKRLLDQCNAAGKRIVRLRMKALAEQRELRTTAIKNASHEKRVNGLTVLWARFLFTDATSGTTGDKGFANDIDAVIPLNSMIQQSYIYAEPPIHKLKGLYHPSMYADTTDANLYIVYSFEGQLYKAMIRNHSMLSIPDLDNHTLLTGKEAEQELNRIDNYNSAHADEEE